MIDKPDVDAVMPFAGLSPDVVLDAAASLGFEGDGRLFALNSYENRVYQMGRPEGALVLKFYRPGRWTDAQIAEEHAFTAELAAAEMAVAAPSTSQVQTLFRFEDFRFAVFPWLRGRAPELDAPGAAPDARAGARPPASDRCRAAFPDPAETLCRPARLRRTRAGARKRAVPGEHGGIVSARDRCAARTQSSACSTKWGRRGRSACTAIAISATCSGTSTAPCSSISTTA